MKNRIFKYFFLIFSILLTGWGMSRNAQEVNVYISDSGDNTEECYCSGYGGSEFGQMNMILTARAAVVAPAESYRTGEAGHCRDYFKSFHICFKNFISPGVSGKGERFMHLLSNRYSQGFYIYTLEKLII